MTLVIISDSSGFLGFLSECAARRSVFRNLLNGAAVDAATKKGWTALMVAAYHGREAMAKLLLDEGAAVDAVDKDGWTALIIAARNGLAAVATLLLDKGAAVDKVDYEWGENGKWGNTALDHARDEGHADLVALLERAEAEAQAEA